MTRDEVLSYIRAHLADELELDPARVEEGTRFKEDLEADSLDLYSLVQELEDTYGVRMSDEQAARITTVGQAVDFVLANGGPRAGALTPARASRPARGAAGRSGPAGGHARVVDRAARGQLRAAGPARRLRARPLGHDAPVPAARRRGLRRRPADEDPRAGGLGPVVPRGGRAARAARAAAGRGAARRRAGGARGAGSTERVLASVIEAVIGACFLAYGFEPTAQAVREAFAPEIEQALERPADFKSALQERLARRGAVVLYEVTEETGPPHERTFEVAAVVEGATVARGSGAPRRRPSRPRPPPRSSRTRWGPDVHLRSITLKGFKSFPDRTRLEFSPGVSVIVGPNGSGKSNVTDAVLWAMGEQSPLAVRGQSMQDVIFAGAHGVQARSEAEVEVVLDNGDSAVGLPLWEISIVRRITRAGEGEYRVNGARCRLTDVLELLWDTGLGKEMHSVVSQGRVAEIVTSKPRDRRLLIEEAAGLGKHRKRRRRAQLKLDRTQDNLDRALDVEREARTRLKPLKRQAEAAELHERLERQTDEARWTLARDAARAAAAALAGAEAQVAAARAAAGATEAELRGRQRREPAEQALAARGDEREGLQPLPRGPLGARAHRDAARGRAPGRRHPGRARRPAPGRAGGAHRRGRGRHGRRRRGRARRSARGGARAARAGPRRAPGAGGRGARGAPRGRRRGGGAARRRGRADRGRTRGPTPRPRRRAPRAASSSARPRRPAARPPASAPSSPRSTSSCARRPARPAAPRRSPTR